MTKITNFPEALDTADNLPDISGSDRMNQAGIEHDVQHTTLNQAVIRLQKKVGKDQSEDQTSLDWRVKNLEDNGTGGAGLDVLDDPNPVFEDLDLTLVVPDNPSLWFVVEIAGERYAVPGYKVAKIPEPPTLFTGEGNVNFIFPTKFNVKQHWQEPIA